MNPLLRSTPETIFERNYVGDTNGSINYGRTFDDQYGNYLRQSGLQKLGRFAGNLIGNTVLESIRGVGSLYELGKRGVEKLDNFSEGTSINDTLFKINDKDDNDFANILTEFADKYKNPAGEIYTRDNSTFDLGSASWWLNQGQSVLPTVLEFAGESALLGTGLGKAALKLGEFLNVGTKGANALTKAAQGLTSYAVTKHESYMMAAQSYQTIFNDYLRKYEEQNPLASTQDKLKARQDAAKAAADGANYVDTIYTALALPFNITGLNSIFAKKGDDIYDIFKSGAGANRQAKLEAYKQQIENLSVDNPYLAKALQKESFFGWRQAREAAFEGFEEVEGQFAQEAGENKNKGGSDLEAGLGELKNFFKYTMNEEGALNLFMGAFIGGTQTALLENLPIHKVNKLNTDGNLDVTYKDGKPVVQTQYVNSRTRDAYDKQQVFKDYKDAIIHDVNHITGLQNQLAKEQDPYKREEIKRELFHIQALDSVEKGLGSNFINSIKEIVNIDNTKSIAEDLLPQIEQLKQQYIIPQQGVELTEEQEAQNIELGNQINELNKQYVENKDTTLAMQSNLATNKDDNEYKRRGEESIAELQQIQKYYDENIDRFSDEEKEVGLHKLATKLQADILGRERIDRDRALDIEKEKANIQLFEDIGEIAQLDDYMQAYNYEAKKTERDSVVNAIQEYTKTKDKKVLEPFLDLVDKDVWDEEEVVNNLKQQLNDKNKSLQEENDLLRNNIKNLQAYQDFAKGDESDEKISEFLAKVNSKSEGLSNLANLNYSLQRSKERTEAIKKHLNDILVGDGRKDFRAKSLQRLADLNKLLVDDFNSFTYREATKKNADNFYINKLNKVQVQKIEAINLEIKNIQDKLVELKNKDVQPKGIKAYYDSFLAKYTKAVTNEQLVQAYEERLDYLSLLLTRVNQNVEVKKEQIKQANTQTQKQEIVNAAQEDSLFDEEDFQATENQQEVENIAETQLESSVPSNQVEEKQNISDIVEQTQPTEITIDKVKFKKEINGLKDFFNIDVEDFIKTNLSTLQTYTKKDRINKFLASINEDIEDDINRSEASKFFKIYDSVYETKEESVIIVQQTPEVEAKVEEVKQVVKEAINTTKDLGDYIFNNRTYQTQDRNSINKYISQYLDALIKGNFADKTALKATESFTQKFTLSKEPRNQYELGIKVSNWLSDNYKLAEYQSEIDFYESKLGELNNKAKSIDTSISEDIKDDLDKQETPIIEPIVITNVDQQRLEKQERDFQDEIYSNKVEYVAEKNGQINEDYIDLLNPEFLNVGDIITLERQNDNDVEAEGWSKSSPLTSDNLVVRIKKGDKLIGFLTQNLVRLKQFSNESDSQYQDRLTRIEELEQTKEKRQQLENLRKALFIAPEGSKIEVKVTSKTSGFNKRSERGKLISNTNLLQDSQLKFVLSSSSKEGKEISLRDSTNDDTIDKNTIGNFDLLSKADTLGKASLFISYPSAISGQINLAPCFVKTIEKDYKTLEFILNELYKDTKPNREVLDLIKNEVSQDYNDLTKATQLEAFINQYFGYVYNYKALENYETGLAVLKDGNIQVKVGDQTAILKKGKLDAKFYPLLKQWMQKTNKNITIANSIKNYTSGINQDVKFNAPVLEGNKLISKPYNNYNDYIAEYVETRLTAFNNSPTGKPIYYTAPIYQYDILEAINKAKALVNTKEQIIEPVVERKIDESRLAKRKKINAKKNELDNNLTVIHTKASAKTILRGLQRIKNISPNDITKVNKNEFNNFPVMFLTGTNVTVNESVLAIYQKQNSTKDLDILIVKTFKEIQTNPYLTNNQKLVEYRRLDNIKTSEDFSKYKQDFCK